MPRPGTPVIPRGAFTLPRQVSASGEAMPYQVEIADPDEVDPETLDDTTAEYDTTPGQVTYLGPARLMSMNLPESRQYDAVDQPEQRDAWRLMLPLGSRVLQNQRVLVLDADPDYADETLIDRKFRVTNHAPRVFGTELRVLLREEPVPRSTGQGV